MSSGSSARRATGWTRCHNILIDHVTIENSRNAGKIVGPPESRITGITLRDVQITAEHDLVIKDADPPAFDQVTVAIKPGAAPGRPAVVE